MTELVRVEWCGKHERGGNVFAGVHLTRCSFVGCGVSIVDDPRNRTTVQDVRATNCEVRGSTVGAAIVENGLIDGLRTHSPLQVWGAVFRHVTFVGRVGTVMIGHRIHAGLADPATQHAFDDANATYYAGVDWALDISEAEFVEADLRGVPADLVRRDAATQAVVRRENVLDGRWRELDLSRTWWQVSIEFMLREGRSDVVLVAPKRHRAFKTALRGLDLLRAEGIADPD